MAIRKIFEDYMHYPSDEEVANALPAVACQPENRSKFERGSEGGTTTLEIAKKLATQIWTASAR